jgi:uncharacterized RmlC-like cupin family protein
MIDDAVWRADAVRVIRGDALDAVLAGPRGRATAFDFAGTGAGRTWIGRVHLGPDAGTSAHHHGRHEVMLYVISGRAEIRWGDALEFTADVGAGDFVYFSPFVPHSERNPSERDPAEFLVVRSDNERIEVPVAAR